MLVYKAYRGCVVYDINSVQSVLLTGLQVRTACVHRCGALAVTRTVSVPLYFLMRIEVQCQSCQPAKTFNKRCLHSHMQLAVWDHSFYKASRAVASAVQ
jgi:hypothetical protein